MSHKIDLESLAIGTLSEHPHDKGGPTWLFAARWHDAEGQYHIWLHGKPGSTIDGSGVEDIYKNPPRGVKRNELGYFRTRYLKAQSKAWAPIVAAVVEHINATKLLDHAIAEEVKANARELAQIEEGA